MNISASYGQQQSTSSGDQYGPLGNTSGLPRGQVQNLFRDMLLRQAPQMEAFAGNAGVPEAVRLPQLDSLGLYAPQRAAFDQAVKQAFSRASGSSAMQGQLRPENFAAVAGSAAQNVAPSFAPMIGQNVRDASMVPFQTALQSLQGKLQAQAPLQNFMQTMIAALGNQGHNQSASRSYQGSGSYGDGKSGDASAVGAMGGAFCWVAGALYGEGSPEQAAIRAWLLAQEQVSRFWAWFATMYRRYGQRIAASRILTRAVKPIFDAILKRAYAKR